MLPTNDTKVDGFRFLCNNTLQKLFFDMMEEKQKEVLIHCVRKRAGFAIRGCKCTVRQARTHMMFMLKQYLKRLPTHQK